MANSNIEVELSKIKKKERTFTVLYWIIIPIIFGVLAFSIEGINIAVTKSNKETVKEKIEIVYSIDEEKYNELINSKKPTKEKYFYNCLELSVIYDGNEIINKKGQNGIGGTWVIDVERWGDEKGVIHNNYDSFYLNSKGEFSEYNGDSKDRKKLVVSTSKENINHLVASIYDNDDNVLTSIEIPEFEEYVNEYIPD